MALHINKSTSVNTQLSCTSLKMARNTRKMSPEDKKAGSCRANQNAMLFWAKVGSHLGHSEIGTCKDRH